MKEETRQLSLRLPVELLERIELRAEELREANPGLQINRAAVLRMLIAAGLEAADQQP